MSDLYNRIESMCDARNISITKMCTESGASRASLSDLKMGRKNNLSAKTLTLISSYFGISIDALLGNETVVSPVISDDTVLFPVLGGVAAGYDRIAYEDWTGDSIEIPRSYLRGHDPQDYFVLRVKGDSMYPDYKDGDHVLVLRQATMDRSGQVGVVIYGDEAGTLKRVEYVMGEDWMTLRPVNPLFNTITGENLEHCRVLGVAKMLIREIED